MIEFLLSLPTWIGFNVTLGYTAVAGFVVDLVFYKLIQKYKREDVKEPTSKLVRVVGIRSTFDMYFPMICLRY